MKPRLSFLFLILLLGLNGSSFAVNVTMAGESLSDSAEKPVRVRIFQDQQSLEIFGMNLNVDQKPIGHSEARKIAIPKTRFEKIKIQVSSIQGRPHFLLESYSDGFKKMKVIAREELQLEGQFMTAQGKELPSRLKLSRQSSKRMDVVGDVEFETYLIGVLSSEMPTSWPLEALKAQAVAARSYTLAVLEERGSQHFDLESSVMDQVFKYPRNLSSEAREKVRRAVRETAGVILKEDSGRPLKAFYHADCGGQTKTPRQVWGQNQGKEDWQTALDASCPRSPKAKWSLQLSPQKLNEKLGLKSATISEIHGPFREQGKEWVYLLTAQGARVKFLANDFRAKLGFDQLKSTRFLVQRKNGNFVFDGRGHGHGVGLCQWGTRAHAERGQSYQQILSHYYKSAKLMYTVSQNEKSSF